MSIDPAYAQRVLDLLDQGAVVELVIREGNNRHLTIEVGAEFRSEIEFWVKNGCLDALTFKPDFQI